MMFSDKEHIRHYIVNQLKKKSTKSANMIYCILTENAVTYTLGRINIKDFARTF